MDDDGLDVVWAVKLQPQRRRAAADAEVSILSIRAEPSGAGLGPFIKRWVEWCIGRVSTKCKN